MAERGEKLIGVRIDSGDLPAQAHAVREILNEAGLQQVKILGSGGLDEYDLDDYSIAQVPFDSYGVGTKMGISADAPWTDMSYKLVEYAGRPVQKLSPEKFPGRERNKCFASWTSAKGCVKTRWACAKKNLPTASRCLKTSWPMAAPLNRHRWQPRGKGFSTNFNGSTSQSKRSATRPFIRSTTATRCEHYSARWARRSSSNFDS